MGPGGANIPLNLRWNRAVCAWGGAWAGVGSGSRGLWCPWGTESFVCGHAGKPHSPEAGSKARVAAGVVGNYHFAGVKPIVFCSLFILGGIHLKILYRFIAGI